MGRATKLSEKSDPTLHQEETLSEGTFVSQNTGVSPEALNLKP